MRLWAEGACKKAGARVAQEYMAHDARYGLLCSFSCMRCAAESVLAEWVWLGGVGCGFERSQGALGVSLAL